MLRDCMPVARDAPIDNDTGQLLARHCFVVGLFVVDFLSPIGTSDVHGKTLKGCFVYTCDFVPCD